MLGHLYEGQDCSAARALELMGERWSLLILRDALFGGRARFSEFQASLGIAPNILTKRLNDMVASGLLAKRAHPSRPDQYVYEPTEMGREVAPIIIALTTWGDRWVRPGPVAFAHGADCHEIRPALWCATCQDAVDAADVYVIPSSEAGATSAHNRRALSPR